jgi:hypothetical protein
VTRNRRPSEQRADLLTALGRLERFAHDHALIVARLRDWSAGVGGSGGPQPKNAVSDPTGQAAMSTDEWGQMRQRVDDLIHQAWRAACDLEDIRRQVAAPALPKEPEERGLAKCANPACPDDAWAVKAGRCDACYQFRRRTDRDRRKSKDHGESVD